MNQPQPTVAPSLVLAILQALITALPQLATWLAKGLEDDDSPLAEQVRAILPEGSASAAARRALERRSP